MIIDFHSHSNASDGSLAPLDLVRRAADAGISRFAITDHDTVAGYREVLTGQMDLPPEFSLIPGVELSCQWAKTTIHVVGLEVDVDHPVLARGLEQLSQARLDRGAMIGDRLDKLGFPGALAGAQAVAGESQLGRPHFARWMVDQGHIRDANEAFDKYLGSGKTGDVKAFWPTLEEVTGWLLAAGGTAVLAHPGKYKMTRTRLRALITDFKAAGGGAIEVVCGRQPREQSLELCKLAADYELMISAGSDFHRFWDYGPRLGVDVSTLPPQPSLWRKERT